MQSFTDIPSSQSLQSSLALLLNNDKTALSQSAATAFPTTNLHVGMPCFRTDQNKLYILKDTTPTWVMVLDLNALPVKGVAQLPGGIDLNTVLTTGFYRLESFANGPSATGFGQLIVCAAGNDTVTQIYGEYTTGTLFTRSGNTALGGGAWSAWRKQWHDGHAGHGTGMNADMLDGRHADNASGSVPVSNGTLNANLNADMLDGRHAGNSAGQVPVSNGSINTDLNADMLDGFHANSFVRTVNSGSPDGAGNVNISFEALTPGMVATFSMNAAPAGWMKANGAAVSRTTYAALFAAIGTTFGAGNGSTTFNLPDLRGEFIRGWDDARGVDSGRTIGSTQGESFLSHTHSGSSGSGGGHSHTISALDLGGGSYGVGMIGNGAGSVGVSTNYVGDHGHSLSINSTGGSETRPRNVALLACIKY